MYRRESKVAKDRGEKSHKMPTNDSDRNLCLPPLQSKKKAKFQRHTFIEHAIFELTDTIVIVFKKKAS